MTLCDPCLREIGSAMQEMERQGVDPFDPDNRYAAPAARPSGGGCVVAAIGLLALPVGVVVGLIEVIT
ncbi:hypothetical protein [Micromonospora okii]|nr:hypothetical protein [Micromonospora okii]